MPAQRRPHPHPSPPPPPPPPPSPAPPTFQDEEDDPQNQEDEENQVQETEGAEEEQNPDDDSDEDGGDASEYNEFIAVKLADLRKEVQCPICLGIIRKTRTVMECLHRFCRECIDKSMRLGNNECPACRTHCASRRSLRDDPNFDALIAALFSDIDEYEKEELDLLEEEKNHYKKIQASIAETFRRQSEALGKRKSTAVATAAAFARKSPGSYRSFHGQCGRGGSSDLDVSLANSEDDEEEDANSNGVIEFSSSDEPSPDRRQKRRRRSATRSSLAQIPGNVGITHEKKCNVETKRDNRGTSPLQVGNGEILSWGGGGVRSQTRHGSSGSSGRLVKGGRRTKQVEYFSGLAKNDNEFDMHLALLPMDEQCAAKLQRPYICCRPSLSIRHLCQFIALQTSVREEEVEILARKPCTLVTNTEFSPSEELQVVGPQESIAELRHSCTNCRGDLVFVYRFKKPS